MCMTKTGLSLRGATSFLFGNWFARIYLAVVAATAVLVVVSYATWQQPDANLAGIWLFLVTAPLSLVFLPIANALTDQGPDWVAAAGIVVCVVCALVNTAAISGMVRLVRRS